MRMLLPVFAILGIATAPAMAQASPQPQPQSQAAPAKEPKTVTKIVCERVNVEGTTGSRLGAAPKVCKKVTVPATEKDAHKAQPHGHSANAH